MAKAYKYRGGSGILDKCGKSIFERDVKTIVNNQIYLPTRHLLNDPTEGFYNDDVYAVLNLFEGYNGDVLSRYSKLKEKISSVGIYSLSKNINNELLWAYYADGHRGFAIEYDIDILKKSSNHNKNFSCIYDFNVEYVPNIPKLNISITRSEDINDILKLCIGSKSLSWKHEEEYRLVIDKNELWDIDYRAITGIYFGYRTPDKDIDYIMRSLRGRGLKYYKMQLVEQTYIFEPIEIPDKYIDSPKYVANNVKCEIDELLSMEEYWKEGARNYIYKLREAIERVKLEPLITKINSANIDMENGKPIFIIWADTKSGVPPVRNYNFRLDDAGELYLVEE